MDIHLLRTFLAVGNHGGLRKAAEFLHLTPSAVSARIQQLEREMGIALFERHRNGVLLTAAGHRLKDRAEDLIQEWLKIRKEVLKEDVSPLFLRVGSTDMLWKIYLQSQWDTLLEKSPHCRYLFKTGGRNDLEEMLFQDALDCVILPEEIKYPGVACQKLGEIALIQVRSSTLSDADAIDLQDFIDIDWGENFRKKMLHDISFTPKLMVDEGWLGLDWLLRHGGTAWLPMLMVKTHLEQEVLYRVEDVECIKIPIYASFNKRNDEAYDKLHGWLNAQPYNFFMTDNDE